MSKSNRHRIRESKSSGNRFQAQETNFNDLPVVFSFQKIQTGDYCFQKLDKAQKVAFADSLYRRREMTKKAIQTANKHGLGTEKIAKSSLTVNVQNVLSEEMDHILVMRYNGYKPMGGYFVKNIFYVLWIEGRYSFYSH